MSVHLDTVGSGSHAVWRIGCRTNDSERLVLVRTSLISHVNFVLLTFALSLVMSCASSRYETYQGRTVMASWYGAEFQGRPTASGERFDMYALTCAHRELPFGSILEVMNVANRKTVRCVVNDRGPFVSGREIDLSYAAAREIGLVGTGTALVKIVYVGREAGYVKEVKYASSGGPYTIQVGAFTEMGNALRLKSGLELKYKEVYIIEATVKEVTFYRVRIGKFQKREEAFSIGKALADEGYSPLITHYDNRVSANI